MPLYGKGRTRLRRTWNVAQESKKNLRNKKNYAWIKRIKNRRVVQYHNCLGGFHHSPLSMVQRNLKRNIRNDIARLVRRKPNAVVADWGCGEGTAITELAKLFPHVRCLGFANERSTEWLNNGRVEFIHATAEDFHRYFKDGTIDYMFSHYGLMHIAPSAMPAYVHMLVRKLAPMGTLVFNNFRITPKKVQRILGKKARVQFKKTNTGDLIYTITKA